MAAPLTREEEAFLARLEGARLTHPANRAARYLTRDLLLSLTPAQRQALYRCCSSGADNLDSEVGCYLLHADDLRDLQAFFVPLLCDYHRAAVSDSYLADWDLPDDDRLDLATLGLPPLSMRVRVGRNVQGFNLPGRMSRAERIRFERSMLESLRPLLEHPDYGGRVYSLTPDFGAGEPNPNPISAAEYQALVDAHIMFKDMAADRFLKSAGLASDWPYGRACYVSRDREVIVWIGEEDHLRIMCMQTGTRLGDVFARLRQVIGIIEVLSGISFVRDERFGYITSCPSNLGTGMRASVHVAMPHITSSGADVKATCARFGLSVCGVAGDHTPIGADGVLALSPTRRLFVRERDIIEKLFDGIRQLSTLVPA